MSDYMQNEYETDNGPDDSEYHFSDEGMYDSNLEEESKDQPTLTESSGLANQFASYRRFVVIGGLFAGFILVVYLFISPSNVPPTEIMAASTSPQPVAASPKSSKIAAMTEALKKSVAMPHPEAKTPVKPVETTASKPAPVSLPTPPVTPEVPTPAASIDTTTIANGTTSSESTSPSSLVLPGMLTPPPAAADQAKIADRLAAVEDSNAKMVAQLHAEYSAKLAEFDSQNKASEEQIRSMSVKIASLEAQVTQLTQLLNKQQREVQPPPAVNPAPPSIPVGVERTPSDGNMVSMSLPPSANAKSNYSVQAIIPGRAWLRTENGETITVAEGDTLKQLGRVTKIDPYDGTIQIDTGSKIILLTYGNGDYA